jgi:hypothetical protein
MKTKKRRQSRKKRVGGASGLVLIVEYDRYGNIKTRKLQKMLARHEYMNLNKVDPGTSLSEGIRESFDLDRMQQIFLNFLNIPNDHGPERKTQKNRVVKIALNDKSDIRLIQLVNKVISRLNKIKNKRAEKKLFIIRDKAGKLTKDTKLEFRKKYEEMLAGAFIEDYKIQKKDVDEELLKLLMRMPVLMNLVSIKYGLMNSGEMTLEELQDIYNLDNDRILELVKPEKKARPDVMTYDEILEEENEKLAKQNEELKKKLSGGLNEENESDLVLLDELGEAFAEVPTEVSAVQGVVQTSVESNPAPVLKVGNRMVSNGASMVAPVSASNSNKGSIVASPPVVSNSNQAQPVVPSVAPPVAPPVAANAPGHSQKLDMANPRVKAIEQFNNLLLTKYGGSSYKINQNTTDFLNELKTTQSDPVKLMQYYLIKNILVCIRIDEKNLFTNSNNLKNDSSEFQAIILTLIRILLSYNMRNYEKFKKTFDNNKTIKTICDLARTAANSLSLAGSFRTTIYSYDTIIQNIIDTDIACTDYEKIITIHLNKLYDLFETKEVLYIRRMVVKAKRPKETNIIGDYDETYNTSGTNQNYIFS